MSCDNRIDESVRVLRAIEEVERRYNIQLPMKTYVHAFHSGYTIVFGVRDRTYVASKYCSSFSLEPQYGTVDYVSEQLSYETGKIFTLLGDEA